jgi:hypothetical protein
MLPEIPNKTGATRISVMQFGGLERRIGAGNGTICDMLNLTGADVPVLSSRPKRKQTATLTNGRGIYAAGGELFYVDAGYLYREGTAYPTALPENASKNRSFASMGTRLLIWPDKCIVDTTLARDAEGAVTALGHSVKRQCKFTNGTYAGEPAAGNTIHAWTEGFDWANHFSVGDGVTISGSAQAENNKVAVVREIDGQDLRFYENCFTPDSTYTEVTVARVIPDLDFICVNDNRVWGCKGDTIRCCKLGDPKNWDVFDGISTDAWSVETGTPGSFTGCVCFMGYPIFFKEDRVFKVYGNRPSNYEVMAGATLGVLPGAEKTLAAAGETLYYLSRAGFVRYNGGYPSAMDAALNAKYTAGAAGSDGKKYFVSALRSDNVREFLVFNPETGLWHKEDTLAVRGFANVGGTLYAQTATANIIVGAAADPNEADYESSVTFADFDRVTVNRSTYSFSSKYPVRLWLRMENTADVTVKISYNGGTLETAATIPAGTKNASYIPVPIRRCDRFGMKLSSTKAWKLYGMEIETRTERTNRKGG